MDLLKNHLEALLTFIFTALSFLGVMYAKFSRLDRLELKVEKLEENIKENLNARLDRIENKIDNFIATQVQK